MFDIKKKVLSEVDLYTGKIVMPKNTLIDTNKIRSKILEESLTKKNYSYLELDVLNRYIMEHLKVENNLILINEEFFGNIYKPSETSTPLLNADFFDLKNSVDYTLLYGVNVENCIVTIHYDNNRKKNKNLTIPLENNHIIMFPATCMYYIKNLQKDQLNFIQTILYKYIE